MSNKKITAAVLAVGTELTDGIIQDIHGKYIASLLKEIGVRTKKILFIPDEEELFYSEVTGLISLCDIIIITGGLGPTSDDLTREVVARSTDKKLVFHDSIWLSLTGRLHGRKIAQTNRKQAMIPEGFSILENHHGTAPGFWGVVGDQSILCALPGPPQELRPMLEEQLLPEIVNHFDFDMEATIIGTSMMVPESLLEEALLEARRGTVQWSTRVEPFRIIFTLYGDTKEQLKKVFQSVEEKLGRDKIRERVLDISLRIVDILKERSLLLVTAESCTGGLIGKLITDIPGSSSVFWGAFVTYSNSAKKNILGVEENVLLEHGAVSKETVRAMAKGALDGSDADISVAVSGIAGPEGGSDDKPVGTVWVGIRTKDGAKEIKHRLHGSRDVVRRVASVAALLTVEEAVLFPERLDRIL